MKKAAAIFGIISGIGLLCLGVTSSAWAQISNKGGPVMAGSDHLEANAKDHTQSLDGRVELRQDDSRLRADHVKIFSAAPRNGEQGGWGDIIRMEATGNIYYVIAEKTIDEQTIKGDLAVYTKADDTMIISGNVILTQGQNVLTGSRLIYNKGTGLTTMDANVVGASKGRVRGVFYPDKSKP